MYISLPDNIIFGISYILAAVQRGMDEDDVVAMQMGARDARSLTEKQTFYLDKIKAKLAQVGT